MGTVFGIDTDPAERDAHRELFGPLGFTRYFYGPSARVGWNRGPLLGHHWGAGEVPVVSVKSYSEADLSSLMLGAGGEFWLCYDHEPEARIRAAADPAVAAANYVRTWGRLRTLRDSMPGAVHGLCHLVPILNRWQGAHGFDWSALEPGLALGDVLGMDCYADATEASHGVYTSLTTLLRPARDLAASLELPWAVPEFGAYVATGDDGALAHAEYLTSVIGAAQSWGARWVSYWCHPDGNVGPYHLDVPGQELSLATWRGAVAATGLL